jgi:starvation-inducible outer membrane lipoprotein
MVKLFFCQLQALLATCFMLASCLAYSLALKMEVTRSSEALVDFQQTIQHYIADNRTLIIILT